MTNCIDIFNVKQWVDAWNSPFDYLIMFFLGKWLFMSRVEKFANLCSELVINLISLKWNRHSLDYHGLMHSKQLLNFIKRKCIQRQNVYKYITSWSRHQWQIIFSLKFWTLYLCWDAHGSLSLHVPPGGTKLPKCHRRGPYTPNMYMTKFVLIKLYADFKNSFGASVHEIPIWLEYMWLWENLLMHSVCWKGVCIYEWVVVYFCELMTPAHPPPPLGWGLCPTLCHEWEQLAEDVCGALSGLRSSRQSEPWQLCGFGAV